MHNKTDKGALFISKSLPVVNFSYVNRLFLNYQTAKPKNLIVLLFLVKILQFNYFVYHL